MYAGITHEGLSLDKIANKYEVQPLALGNYQMLQALHEGIRPKEFETRVNLKKETREIEKKYTRLVIIENAFVDFAYILNCIRKPTIEVNSKRLKTKLMGSCSKAKHNNKKEITSLIVTSKTKSDLLLQHGNTSKNLFFKNSFWTNSYFLSLVLTTISVHHLSQKSRTTVVLVVLSSCNLQIDEKKQSYSYKDC